MKYNRLALALLDLRTNPSRELIVAFICGLFIFGLAINGLYSLVTDFSKTLPSLPPLLLSLVALISLAFFAFQQYERRLETSMYVSESSNVPACAYVITALAPLQSFPSGGDNLENVRRLVFHHKVKLQELVLVSVLKRREDGKIITINSEYKESAKVLEAYNILNKWLDENLDVSPIIRLLEIHDPNSAQESFNVVNERLVSYMTNNAVAQADVVVDVTAGTKAITVGMAAAALVNNYRITYQATKRDEEGKPDFTADFRDTSMVFLELDRKFRVSSSGT
jgi:hypothetical protein